MRFGPMLVLICCAQANAARINPQGLVKAALFSFEPRVEQISGIISCDDQLNNLIDDLGRRIADGSSDPHLGAISENAYNEAMANYRQDLFDAAGGNFSDRVRRLLNLIPRRADYDPGILQTSHGMTVDFVNYLIEEFIKLEKAAMVHRSIHGLELVEFPRHRIKALRPEFNSGDDGRAYRMILFLRYHLQFVKPEYEAAVKIFCDSILTSEVIKASLNSHQVGNTRELFRWLHEHNPVMYFYFLERYQPMTTEENLMIGKDA